MTLGSVARGHRKYIGRGDAFVEDPETHCWIWKRSKDSKGYGKIWLDRKNVKVHRLFYEELVGPIPDALQLDHLCRTPACVNPGHVEPVTLQENIRRARVTHCKHGHPFNEANTYVKPDGTRRCRECQDRGRREYLARKAAA